MQGERISETARFLRSVKNGIWILCIPAWLFGMLERSINALKDHFLSPFDMLQVLTATFFLVSWLFLKPTRF